MPALGEIPSGTQYTLSLSVRRSCPTGVMYRFVLDMLRIKRVAYSQISRYASRLAQDFATDVAESLTIP